MKEERRQDEDRESEGEEDPYLILTLYCCRGSKRVPSGSGSLISLFSSGEGERSVKDRINRSLFPKGIEGNAGASSAMRPIELDRIGEGIGYG